MDEAFPSTSTGGTDSNNDGEKSDTDSNNHGENGDTDSNRDGENRDTEDVAEVTVETIEDINKKVIKKEMSIYKVDISKLNIPEKFEGTEEDLESEIDKQLMRNQKDKKTLKYHKLTENKCNPYCLCLFTYQSKTTDPVAHELTTQRGLKPTEFKKNRNTGNIIVFYRLIEGKKPEIFCLCSGCSYLTILKFVDINVRIEMIKRYLKDSNIKSIEYLSFSGPEITTQLLFRTNTEDFFRQFDTFGKIISNVSGEIEPESDLAKCIKEKDETKAIRIDFGAYKVRLNRLLTYQKWTEVIKLISDCMAHESKHASHTQESIINAFESVQKVKDPTLLETLNNELKSRVIDAILNDKDTTDLFLGSNRPEDFTLASSFILKYKQQRAFREIQNWGSSPTLDQVIKALHNDKNVELETNQAIKEALEGKRIVIAFKSDIVKLRQLPIQDLVHGSTVVDDVRYFKLSKFWYRISRTYMDKIDKDFERLAENAVFKDETYMKYTWSYTKQSFSIDTMQQVLGTETDETESIVNILLSKVRPCTGDEFLLTTHKNMYLLPSSKSAIVGLVKDIAEALGDEKKNRERTLKYIWDISRKKKTLIDEMKEILGREFEVVTSVMQENDETQTTYQVKNPIISRETERKLKDKVDIADLLSYLRSLLPLSEGEYNELYLYSQHKNVEIIPGDRVLVKNVELFDILIHDPQKKVTYLFHNKDGFDVKIRDVCSQLRVSANLLWMDYMKGTRTNAQGFWEAGTSKEALTVYRIQLKEKLHILGNDTFISFFDDNIKIVFVLGFRHKNPDYLNSPLEVRSTVAKIELLTLYADFAKYQVGGRRKFVLKVLQLKSDYGSVNNTNNQEMNVV